MHEKVLTYGRWLLDAFKCNLKELTTKNTCMASEQQSVWRRMLPSLLHHSSGVCLGQSAWCFRQHGPPILGVSVFFSFRLLWFCLPDDCLVLFVLRVSECTADSQQHGCLAGRGRHGRIFIGRNTRVGRHNSLCYCTQPMLTGSSETLLQAFSNALGQSIPVILPTLPMNAVTII